MYDDRLSWSRTKVESSNRPLITRGYVRDFVMYSSMGVVKMVWKVFRSTPSDEQSLATTESEDWSSVIPSLASCSVVSVMKQPSRRRVSQKLV